MTTRLTMVLASLLLIASGCASTDERLTAAATLQGKAAATSGPAILPADCTTTEAAIDPHVGEKWRAVLVRANDAIDRQNGRTRRCGNFHLDFEKGQ